MPTKHSGTISVVVSRIDNPFYPELLQALSRELDGLAKRMIVWNSQGPDEKAEGGHFGPTPQTVRVIR